MLPGAQECGAALPPALYSPQIKDIGKNGVKKGRPMTPGRGAMGSQALSSQLRTGFMRQQAGETPPPGCQGLGRGGMEALTCT